MSFEGMEIGKLVNSLTDGAFLDKIFDFKPALPEIYLSRPEFVNGGSSSMISPESYKSHVEEMSSGGWNSYNNLHREISANTSSPKLISFGNSSQSDRSNGVDEAYAVSPKVLNFSPFMQDGSNINQYDLGSKRICAVTRNPLQAQDHIMAERKRREKLNQLFISLSKVCPGLKKLDKASLLEEAINHIKFLEERVSVLEEEEAKKGFTATSNASAKRVLLSTDDHDIVSSSEDSFDGSNLELVPEIKVRFSNNTVLVKICCKKQKGIMSRVPSQLEKLHLNVLDIRSMPFGSTALDITVLAQMDSEFCGTGKDIVEHLELIFESL